MRNTGVQNGTSREEKMKLAKAELVNATGDLPKDRARAAAIAGWRPVNLRSTAEDRLSRDSSTVTSRAAT